MDIVTISNPEIVYSTHFGENKLIRRILFHNDIFDERCSMDPRSIYEMYPVSYTTGKHSGVTTGYQWMYTFGVDIILSDVVISNIVTAMGKHNKLVDRILEVIVDTECTPWTNKAYYKGEITIIESTKNINIELDGRLELYLEFMECSRHEDPTCYAETHGKSWKLKGKFITGSIDLVS
jgi:hypothetical protein